MYVCLSMYICIYISGNLLQIKFVLCRKLKMLKAKNDIYCINKAYLVYSLIFNFLRNSPIS